MRRVDINYILTPPTHHSFNTRWPFRLIYGPRSMAYVHKIITISDSFLQLCCEQNIILSIIFSAVAAG